MANYTVKVSPQYLHYGETDATIELWGLSPGDRLTNILLSPFSMPIVSSEQFDDHVVWQVKLENGYPRNNVRYQIVCTINGTVFSSGEYLYADNEKCIPTLTASANKAVSGETVTFSLSGIPTNLNYDIDSFKFGSVIDGEIVDSDDISIDGVIINNQPQWTVTFSESAKSGQYVFGAEVDLTNLCYNKSTAYATVDFTNNSNKGGNNMALNLPTGWSYDATTGVITVPEGTTTIDGDSGFRVSTEVTKLVIPSGITSIGEQAFYACTNLTSVKIPEGVTVIGRLAFGGLGSSPKLSEIYLPSTITAINDRGFNTVATGCNTYINMTKSEWNALSESLQMPTVDHEFHFADDSDYETWKDNFETSDGGDDFVKPDPVSPEKPTEPEDPDDPDEPVDPEDPDLPDLPEPPDAEDPLCITPSMLEILVTQILGKVNERISARIVNVISDTSDDKHVPSALAVFNFLRTVTPGMSCQTVVGSMDTVTEPNSRIIYLQKDDENDQTWTMYLWVDGAWVSIGDTSIDLVNYWSKSDADIAELREKLLDTDGLQSITDGLDLTNVLRNDDASKAIVLEWVGSSSAGSIGEADMASIIEAVLVETDKLYVKKDELPTTLGDYVRKDELATQISVITEPQITSAVNAAFAATDPGI